MNSKELAEKIYELAGGGKDLPCGYPAIESLLEAALGEARLDALNKQRHTLLEINRYNVKETYEDAAKIAESYQDFWGRRIAELIRAKAGEVGK